MTDARPTAPSKSLSIRRLAAGDVETFRALRLEALRCEPAAFASTAAEWEALDADGWRRWIADATLLAAHLDGEPVGLMGFMRQRASKMAHRASVVMVYVRPEHRGTGLAEALLSDLCAEAACDGVVQLELAVTAENGRAVDFYRRAGFAEIGRIPGGFRHEGREIDEILMAMRIAPAARAAP
ncbi:GNAT family N-acetyltransferase [Rhizobium sp. TRM95111]|uniref:GNAT family N-acetyltransferase n=1 Tax=Rhizobium alarense TaxID=2846851 RepID=UPI001F458128|nr:GNAT family N-acetyltransferase [Rhizobium alarense]MCF3638565.1 GNAT family N-acetyltransferase [Rhizobium alarense]